MHVLEEILYMSNIYIRPTKPFDIAVAYVIWHISIGLFSWIHQNNIYSYSETSGGNTFVNITMLYTQRIIDWQCHWQLEIGHGNILKYRSSSRIYR